jgi:UDP-glucose 4-epimerase
VVDRRPGDVASVYADPSKAEQELSWRAERSIDQMCADVWRWQSANPDGYS